MFDRAGTSEHTRTDEFEGLIRRNAMKRRARDPFRSATRPMMPRLGSPVPQMRAKVLKQNIRCAGGTVLHLVDRILFPDEFAMNDRVFSKAEAPL
jgi:hypothetical protein